MKRLKEYTVAVEVKKLVNLQINIVAESGQVKRLKRIYSWSRSEKACHSSNTYCG